MEKIVGELLEVVKALALAAERRGEALDKSIRDRLSNAERGLYEARKAAHEASLAEIAPAEQEPAAVKRPAPPTITFGK